MINTIPCSPREALDLLHEMYRLQMPVFLWGAPGCGKSSLVQQLAGRLKAELIDIRLTTLESVDLRGLCWIDPETRTTRWLRPEFFPTEDRPYIIFLDELTAAEPRIQASSYQLVLDRCIGQHQLPPQAWVVAAGNAPEDRAISYAMGTALADRFLHVRVVANAQDWIRWAAEGDVHPSVIAFIKVKPEYLDSVGGQPRSEQLVTPSPRSWERVSTVLKATQDRQTRMLAVNGLVGEAAAVQFFHTLDEIGNLPDMETLMGMEAAAAARRIPDTLPALYGLAYSLAGYVNGLPDFQQALAILDAVAKKRDVLPRREIQTMGMELLLEKASRLKIMDTLTRSVEYQRLYRNKAREVAR